MVVILRENPDKEQLESLKTWLESMNIDIRETAGVSKTILGLVGDTTQIDIDLISALDIVEDIRRIQEPYKAANKKFHPDPTVVEVADGCENRRRQPYAHRRPMLS